MTARAAPCFATASLFSAAKNVPVRVPLNMSAEFLQHIGRERDGVKVRLQGRPIDVVERLFDDILTELARLNGILSHADSEKPALASLSTFRRCRGIPEFYSAGRSHATAYPVNPFERGEWRPLGLRTVTS